MLRWCRMLRKFLKNSSGGVNNYIAKNLTAFDKVNYPSKIHYCMSTFKTDVNKQLIRMGQEKQSGFEPEYYQAMSRICLPLANYF